MIAQRIAKESRRIIAQIVLATLLFAPCYATAQHEAREYKVEAAYLYNFFNYITWPGLSTPQDLQAPVICLYEKDPVEQYLVYIQRRRTNERHISIRHIDDASSLEGCHIIFLRNRSPEDAGILTPPYGGLIISGKPGVIEHGAMIELFKAEESIRMKVNQALLEKNSFSVSSRLLSLAEELKK